MIKKKIESLVKKTLEALSLPETSFVVEHSEEILHGDYSTNVALLLAKDSKKNPREVAEIILRELQNKKISEVERIEIAGPGFINFFLTPAFFANSVKEILSQKEEFGKNDSLQGKKTIVEYTDPNPIKEFHIGHLMSNAIGESLAAILSANGAEVKRACYQGDVGLHVAKAVAQQIDTGIPWVTVKEVASDYARGSKRYEIDDIFKKRVIEVNKLIYNKEENLINKIYQLGRQLALDYFETIYKTLGTQFDFYFFESTTGEFGKALVHKHPEVFEKSEGAIVFRGEKRDRTLHTRVFINKEGLPTYEAKELGLAKIKHDIYPYDNSIVITGNEINDYFRVLLCAMKEIFPDLAQKTQHVPHGMLRLPTGKMSSRTGDVITAESLIDETKKRILEKIEENDRNIENKEELALQVAVAAIKYSILKQAPGKDIIFDFEKSISFDGDSGPYIQYAFARTQSILKKARDADIKADDFATNLPINELMQKLYRFSEVVERSGKELVSHYIVTYLTEIASLFNRFYAEEQIVDATDPLSGAKVALTAATGEVLRNGLKLLGISAPEKM